MKQRHILPGLLIVLLCLSAVPAFAQDEARPPARKLEITVGKDVTVFDGPLREDGTIDYIAALNKKYSEGVTKDNNAFRALFLLFPQEADPGNWFDDPAHIEAVNQMLGVTPAELKASPKLVGWYDYAELKGKTYEQAAEIDERFYLGPFDDEGAALYVEWMKQAVPALEAAWVAVQKPAYWSPQIATDETGLLVNVLMPELGNHRELARSLQKWAYYSAANGDYDKTLQAIRTLRQLAVHQSKQGFLIGSLVAISIDAVAAQTVQHLLAHRVLPDAELVRLEKAWHGRGKREPIADMIAVQEKCFGLDAYMQICAGRVSSDNMFDGVGEAKAVLGSGAFDVNRGLKDVSKKYDRLAQIAGIEDFTMRQRVNELFDKNMLLDQTSNGLFMEVDGTRVPNPAALLTQRGRTDLLTSIFMQLLLPAIGSASNVETHNLAAERTFAALACERYRLKHGEYPASLGALVPDFLDAVPIDPYDKQPMRYKRADAGFVVYAIGENLQDDHGLDDRNEGDVVVTITHQPAE